MKDLTRTIKMILWAFLGVRKKSEFDKDIKINPILILATGFILAVLFVISLIVIVNMIV